MNNLIITENSFIILGYGYGTIKDKKLYLTTTKLTVWEIQSIKVSKSGLSVLMETGLIEEPNNVCNGDCFIMYDSSSSDSYLDIYDNPKVIPDITINNFEVFSKFITFLKNNYYGRDITTIDYSGE